MLENVESKVERKCNLNATLDQKIDKIRVITDKLVL